MSMVLMDAQVVVRLKDVQFGEDGGPFDVVSERPDGREREGVQGGLTVQGTIVSARPVLSI